MKDINILEHIRNERVLAKIISDRDAMIEGLVQQIEQMQGVLNQLEKPTDKGPVHIPGPGQPPMEAPCPAK